MLIIFIVVLLLFTESYGANESDAICSNYFAMNSFLFDKSLKLAKLITDSTFDGLGIIGELNIEELKKVAKMQIIDPIKSIYEGYLKLVGEDRAKNND
uniref:Uncharacterized protein n=1 Tax=Acrobeloides nanus TaxID=290746 RepID=A0A914DGA8_9BILA